jgi:hypothetical protein
MASFMEEIAPFNIGVTIIEHGGSRMDFRSGNAQVAPKIDAYNGTPRIVHSLLQDTSHLPSLFV